MYKYTTPTYRIRLNSIKPSEVTEAQITFRQKEIKLTKTLDDCTLGDDCLYVKLSVAETGQFKVGNKGYLQARITDNVNNVFASHIEEFSVYDSLYEVVL